MVNTTVIRRLRPALLIGFLVLLPPSAAQAQEVSGYVGADLVTSYLWRGFQFADRPQFQPWASVSINAFEVGAWGSYGFDGNYKEQDFWISFHGEMPSGSYSLTLFDYYYTEDFRDFFDAGAHTLELFGELRGPESLPLRGLLGAILNDGSIYGEVGYDRPALGLDWGATVGALFRDGGYYEMEEGGLVNLSLGASRVLAEIWGRELTAGALALHNPHIGDSYFAVSLGY